MYKGRVYLLGASFVADPTPRGGKSMKGTTPQPTVVGAHLPTIFIHHLISAF